MKKIILLVVIIFSLSAFFISCQKSSIPSPMDIETSVNPINFVTIENGTDSGTVSNVSFTKTGYTAIIQRNYLKDSSTVDSIKIRYKDATQYFPASPTLNPTYNTLVDSLVIIMPTPITTKVIYEYQDLATLYYNFTIGSSSFVSKKTYTVIATVYTNKGNSQTATFSSLFKW